MASCVEKLEIISLNNLDYLAQYHDITASWPVLDSLEKFKPRYKYYSWADLDYRKCLRRERLLHDREDPFTGLSPDEIKMKYKFFPHTIMDILRLVSKDLQRPSKKNNPLTPKQVVCTALFVLGNGKWVNSSRNPSTPFCFVSFRIRKHHFVHCFACKNVLAPL